MESDVTVAACHGFIQPLMTANVGMYGRVAAADLTEPSSHALLPAACGMELTRTLLAGESRKPFGI